MSAPSAGILGGAPLKHVIFKDGQPQPRRFVPCPCQAETRPGLVLDPFFGAGTVALVAQQYGREWLGIELNQDYLSLVEQRLGIGLSEAA